MINYPKKLRKEPLVHAAFEVRFQSTADASVIIPGLLYAHLGISDPPVRVGPDLPTELLASVDQNFAYQPRIQLNSDGYSLLISQKAVAILCPRPYPSWTSFRNMVKRVADVLAQHAKQITGIDRISMRYVDLLTGEGVAPGNKLLRLKIEVADYEPFARPYSLRIERPDGNVTHVVNVAAPASVIVPPNAPQTGTVVDIDSSMSMGNTTVAEWASSLLSTIDELHLKNKAAFFNCLTDTGLQSLEPIYET